MGSEFNMQMPSKFVACGEVEACVLLGIYANMSVCLLKSAQE